MSRLLGLISTSVLARILLPSDFGLVALAYAFVRALDATATLGVEFSLLREPDPDEELYSTAFSVSLCKSFLTAIIVAGFAPYFAEFFDDQRLTYILYVLAFGLLLEGGENLGILEYRKNFIFGKEFLFLMIPRTAAVISCIGMALLLRSYWAMVISILIYKTTKTACSYILHPFRPRFTFSGQARLLRFSFWMWATGIANFLRDRADAFIVGRMTNTASLGLFSAAYEIAILPITELVEPLGRVLFPGISAAYHGGTEAGATVSRSIAAVGFLILPAGVGISLVAGPIIYVTLGGTWMNGYHLVQIIAPAAVFSIFSSVISTTLIVLGNARIITITTIFVSVLRLPILAFGVVNNGLTGVAWAMAICYPLEAAFYIIALTRLTRFRVGAFLRQLWRSLVAVAGMATVLVVLGVGWAPPPQGLTAALEQLLLATIVGTGSYMGIVFALWVVMGYPEGPEALIYKLFRPRLGSAARKLLTRANI